MASSRSDIHRIKVTLLGSKPPIWRRLEVPSNIPLETLHHVVQDAFGWLDCHLWVFETPLGDFGIDPELDHGDATKKKLRDVAPNAGDRIRYTYNFGDNWEHGILVEDVGPSESGTVYPRCLTGRRAGPPEDCGGVWGYVDLVETLANPDKEEHATYLDWLGLESADEFDPAAFDLDEINRALAKLA